MADKSLRFLVVILVLFSIWVVVRNTSDRYEIKKLHESKVKSLRDSILLIKSEKDSLYSELYPCEIELNRFQIAFRILKDRNPKAAEQYGNIISDETE